MRPQIVSLAELTDKYIGTEGTLEREMFDQELRFEVLSYKIKEIRKQRGLNQTEFGSLIGVKKAQVSKLENNIQDVKLSTVAKIVKALQANFKLTPNEIDLIPV